MNEYGTLPASVSDWLDSLGLGQYRETFAKHAIDLAVLPDLTEQNLAELGVEPIGHRKKLQQAIRDLPAAAPQMSAVPQGSDEAASEQGDGELRHLTVLFCDLVDYSKLAAQLNPEDLGKVMDSFHDCVAEVIVRHGGDVEHPPQGDGTLALFGHPIVHEHGAEQAIRAGLALVESVTGLKTEPPTELRVRVGFATGKVFVRHQHDTAHRQRVVGEAPNLAQRLQAIAKPPSPVVICANTRALAGHLFECRDLGPQSVKGWPQSVPAWQVLGPSSVESPFEAKHRSQLPPLRGRDEEMGQLWRRWLEVVTRQTRVVVLTGDAGVGKSHMVFALQEKVEADKHTPHTTLRYFCLANHENSALHPFINQLERAAHFERHDSEPEKFAKLATLLKDLAPNADNTVALALVANLLSLPMAERDRLLEPSPEKRKDQTLDALLALIDALAAQRPVLMIVEDAQWMDPTSKELLARLVEREARLPILLLVTARTDTFKPSWASRAHVRTILLTYLSSDDSKALVNHVAARGILNENERLLPPELMEEILRNSDGLPLYLEECAKTVLESGRLKERGGHYVLNPKHPLTSLPIPPTLHESLEERLDRLREPARAAAEVGAAIGREFSYDLIDAIADNLLLGKHPPIKLRENLGAALRELERSELVFRRGEVPHAVYRFKHALLREEAYEGLVKENRIKLHTAIADVLEGKFPEIATAQPETLGHHLSMAKLPHRAIPYWLEAGRIAAGRFANREAIANLERGIKEVEEATENLPERLERDRFKLELNYELARCLIETKGPGSKETDEIVARVRELCEHVTKEPVYPRVMFWLATASVIRGNLEQALKDTAATKRSAEALGDRAALINAVRGQAMIQLFMGRIDQSRKGIERALELFYKADASQQLATRAAGQDAEVSCHALMSWVLWLLGDVDKAVTQAEKAIERARAIGHPHTEAYTCYYAAILFALRNEHETALHHAARCLALSEEHGFKLWLPLARTIRGICIGALHRSSDALEEAKVELRNYQNKGFNLGITVLCALRAQVLLQNREPEMADEAIDQGLSAVECHGERILEAELYRLKARALLDCGGSEARTAAQDCLERALATARAQRARSLQLRAESDIAKLLPSKAKRAEARRSSTARARNRLPQLGR